MITVLPTASRTDEVRKRFPNRLHIGVAKEQQERSPVFSNILPHHTAPCCRFLSSIGSTLEVLNGSAAVRNSAVRRRRCVRPDRADVSGLVLTVGLHRNALLLARCVRLPDLANPLGLHSAIAFEYRTFVHYQFGCG
jgi:hypothetical protein